MEIKIQIPDDKKNDLTLKRMSLLEKKLDQQYKSFIDNTNNANTDNVRIIQQMQSSFMSNFNKMLEMNKSMMAKRHQDKIDILRDEFARKIESIKKDDNSGYLKTFASKVNSLENAIKNITLKPSIVKVQSGNNKVLSDSFNKILYKLESLIKESRPRMYPSPS